MTITLGAEEQALLKRIAESGGSTVGELAGPLKEEKGWGRSTVQRMIDRLLKKGWLKRELHAGVFVYQAVDSPEEVDAEVVRHFLKTRFDGKFSPLVAYLHGGVKPSPEEIAKLKQLIEQWEKGE